jgi:glycosyltransferase involved in cell wall biosynthesis
VHAASHGGRQGRPFDVDADHVRNPNAAVVRPEGNARAGVVSVLMEQKAVTAVLVSHDGPGPPSWRSVTEPSLGRSVARVLVRPGAALSGAAMLNEVWAEHGGHLLVVSSGVVVPPNVLDHALALIEDDPRVASVSFLTNDGGMLSFPDRNRPAPLAPDGQDEAFITERLRGLAPPAGFATMPFGIGPVVLLSESALRAVGPMEDAPSGDVRASIADLCLRSRSRAFTHVVDLSTFILKPSDLNRDDWSADPWVQRPLSDLWPADDAWISERHPSAHPFVASESEDPVSGFGLGFNVARVKTQGLRVLLDGRSLTGAQMGTQTATMFLAEALARHVGVREVCVALSAEPPPYAREALSRDGIRTSLLDPGQLGSLGRFDISHRPNQPGSDYRPEEWWGLADRHVMTILDLIAFDVCEYFASHASWQEYRNRVSDVVQKADGVVVISADVRDAVTRAGLAVDPSRLYAVPLGTDHMVAVGGAEPSAALAADRLAEKPFLLCLGTNYACRNRDVAINAWQLLTKWGTGLNLVLVGRAIPFGSSRVDESVHAGAEGLFDLPSVSEGDRNWLLANAALVLCTSSADGFGFVPFEAARLGTPSLSVRFGPFREFGASVPVWSRGWDGEAFATAAQQLLDAPALARQQVEARLHAGDLLPWDRTADQLVVAYRDILARPPAVAESAKAMAAELQHVSVHSHELHMRLQAIEQSRSYGLARTLSSWGRFFRRR